MTLRIEKDVPITGKRELPEFVAEVRETLAQMEVGDSFIVEGEKKVTTTRYQISNIYNWDKDGDLLNRRYITRTLSTEPKKVRVWRKI
jgi:hypothetical protein